MRSRALFLFLGYLIFAISCQDKNVEEPGSNEEHPGSNEKAITQFHFLVADNPDLSEDLSGKIYRDSAILVVVPKGTDISSLIPDFELSSELATINDEGARDFTTPVTYRISAENGTFRDYVVLVIPDLQRGALAAIYLANPKNLFDWVITEPDLSKWIEVLDWFELSDDGRIVSLSLSLIETVPPEIAWLQSLKFLGISNCPDLTTIPDAIGQLDSLEILRINSNAVTTVSPELGNLKNLTTLTLINNKLTSIPRELGNLRALRKLDLAENMISDLPEEIALLPLLLTLDMSENNLRIIPPAILTMEQLDVLILRANNLTSFPWDDELDLRDIYLNGNQIDSIPSSIGDWTDLEVLGLSDNQLTEIPVEIAQLTSLITLSLEDNNLVSIPQAVCDMQNNGTAIHLDEGVTCKSD